MDEEEEDPLFSSFTAKCHVTSPQSHRTAAFFRHHLRFPAEDDSFPAVSSGTVDAESTVVTEEGSEGKPDDGFKVVGKRRRRVFEEGAEVESVGLDDGKETCDGFRVGNGTAEKGLGGGLGTGFVDLDESEGVGKGPKEDVSTEVVGLDGNEMCGDLCMRNVVVGDIGAKETWGLDQGISTRGVGLDGKETCGGFGMGNGTVEKGLDGDLDGNEGVGKGSSEDVSTEVVDLDENEMCGDSDMRNNVVGEVGAKEGGQECRDGNRRFADKGIEENDRFQRVGEENDKFCQKGKSVVGSSKLCNDSPRTNLYRDGIRRFVTGFQKGDNIRQKGKDPAETRKLPSSVGGQTKNSTDQTENDQIMKSLLDALDIVTRRAREKVDDGSDEKPDFLETAIKRGIVFPRPRWWPTEGSDDDQV